MNSGARYILVGVINAVLAGLVAAQSGIGSAHLTGQGAWIVPLGIGIGIATVGTMAGYFAANQQAAATGKQLEVVQNAKHLLEAHHIDLMGENQRLREQLGIQHAAVPFVPPPLPKRSHQRHVPPSSATVPTEQGEAPTP